MDAKQFAVSAAKYLSRTSLAPAERTEFNAIETVLTKMAKGELIIGSPVEEPCAKPVKQKGDTRK